MKVRLIVNYGRYVLETLHIVCPEFDLMVRDLVKALGKKRIQIVKV